MSLLVQISDPHFGTERAPVVDALVRLVHRERPRLVVLSGDITQRATAAQFDAARRFVERLQVATVLAIPGNHDIPLFNPWLRFVQPYARYAGAFGPVLEPEHDDAHWRVLTLKTTRRWRHEDGEVSSAQIARVADRLRQAAPSQLRIVVVHQPVAVPRAAESKTLLRRHDEAIREWAAAGVDLILAGHIHLPYVLPLHERLPGLPRRVWAVNAGTAVSERVRHEAGNSVNLLRVEPAGGGPPGCVVERWDYVDARRGFEAAARHRLSCGRPPARTDELISARGRGHAETT